MMTISNNEIKEFLKVTKTISSQNSSVYLSQNCIEVVSILPITNYLKFNLGIVGNLKSRLKLKMSTFVDLLKAGNDRDGVEIKLDDESKYLFARSKRREVKTADWSMAQPDEEVPVYSPTNSNKLLDTKQLASVSEHGELFISNTTVFTNINGLFCARGNTYSTNSYSLLARNNSLNLNNLNIFIPSHVFNLAMLRDGSSIYVDEINSKMIVSDAIVSVVLPNEKLDENLAENETSIVEKLENLANLVDKSESVSIKVEELLKVLNNNIIRNLKPKKISFGFDLTKQVKITFVSESNMEYNAEFDLEDNKLSNSIEIILPADELSKMINLISGYSTVSFYPNSDRVIGVEFGDYIYVLGKSGNDN